MNSLYWMKTCRKKQMQKKKLLINYEFTRFGVSSKEHDSRAYQVTIVKGLNYRIMKVILRMPKKLKKYT